MAENEKQIQTLGGQRGGSQVCVQLKRCMGGTELHSCKLASY